MFRKITIVAAALFTSTVCFATTIATPDFGNAELVGSTIHYNATGEEVTTRVEFGEENHQGVQSSMRIYVDLTLTKETTDVYIDTLIHRKLALTHRNIQVIYNLNQKPALYPVNAFHARIHTPDNPEPRMLQVYPRLKNTVTRVTTDGGSTWSAVYKIEPHDQYEGGE